MYLPSSVETLVSFCMTGLCVLVLGISCFVNIVDRTFGLSTLSKCKVMAVYPKADNLDVTARHVIPYIYCIS